jgi:hypothetical protein
VAAGLTEPESVSDLQVSVLGHAPSRSQPKVQPRHGPSGKRPGPLHHVRQIRCSTSRTVRPAPSLRAAPTAAG